jgi:hypothetical protein
MLLKLISLQFLNFFASTESLSVSSINSLENTITIKKQRTINSVQTNNLRNPTIAESQKTILPVQSL